MKSVLKLENLPEGHSHQIDHGEYKVLLTNVDGAVYAIESKCSHFGLPLENAAVCGHRVRCPFHHACFDVRTGAQIESPGLDGIATFGVEVRDGEIYVSDQPKPVSLPSTAPAAAPDATHFEYAIVGGGIAAANAVYGIREYDDAGSIVMITKEDLPPYDRTHVSKALLAGGKEMHDLPVQSEAFYQERGVTLLDKTTATEVDVENKKISVGERSLTYNKVLLATGGQPRKLDVPGATLGGIFTIRNARDGQRIREKAKKGSKVVIVGGSFIGLEAAMSLGKKGVKITVIAPETTLFERVFGKQVGDFVQGLHEAAGVTFKLGQQVTEITGKGSVNAVLTSGGERVRADLVVVGIGVTPSTGYLKGLAANDDGGIKVNNHLAANAGDTWVAGDIAEYPDRTGAARIEHWKVAAQQGRVAGRNMAGHPEAYTMLPFFWSNQQGTNLRYAGHASDYDTVLLDGVPGEGPFLAFYLKGDQLQAMLGVKRDKDVAVIAEAMHSGNLPPKEELLGMDWAARTC